MVALPLAAANAASGSWGGDLVAGLEAAAAAQSNGIDTLPGRRALARRRLQEQPLPSRRLEDWRFTDTAALAAIRPAAFDGEAHRLAQEAAASLPKPGPATLRLRLDGQTDPLQGLTLPAGLEPIPASAWAELLAPGAEPWTAAVAAAAAPVLALRVHGEIPLTLELLSETGAAEGVLALQLLLVLEPGASLELLEVHRAGGASLTAVNAEIRLASGATLRHGLIAQGDDRSVLLADLAVSQEPGSSYALTSAVSGWGLSRLEPRVLQRGGAATTRLRSLQRCDGRQVADQHSLVRFEGPEGVLDQLHKTIAAGAGRSVFNGAVQVPRLAQRTAAAQLSRSLLLSDRARVDSKPQLEIVADDVTCTHGATVSRLQEDQLFYLRSRGVAAEAAGRLLLRGFCAEILDEMPAAAALWQPLQVLLGEEVAAS